MSDRQPTDYGVVLPTYNTRDLTIECVEMLLKSHHPPATVVVVDNGTDGTSDLVEAAHPSVLVVRNASNTGFAAAINAGSELLTEPFILWLNSDVLLDPDDMSRLLEEAERDDDLAAIGPRQIALDGHELRAVHRFPSALRPFRRKRPTISSGSLGAGEFLSGACLMIRRLAWTATGPLDDSFFFYWEEADWQFRARRLGWQLALADVAIRHVGSGSADGQSMTLRLLSFEGYERFILKHEGKAALLLHRVTNLPGVLWSAWTPLIRHPRGDRVRLRRDATAAHARLTQLFRPVPPDRTSPWAARVRGQR